MTRRRLCMPATTDVWVQQQDAQPLFVVTAPANDDLLAMLRREILPEIRRLVGERRVTLCFDREGWSPKFFHECHAHGFDVLTYRRGAYAAWPPCHFRPDHGDGERPGDPLHLGRARRGGPAGLPDARGTPPVRQRAPDGDPDHAAGSPIGVVAYRMFERWTQENFFRYMRQHFALDALVTYAVEPADPDRTIPNPERKARRKQLAEARAALKALEQAYGHAAQTESRRPAAHDAGLQDRARRPRPTDPGPGARAVTRSRPDRRPARAGAPHGGAGRRGDRHARPGGEAPDRHHQDGGLSCRDGPGPAPWRRITRGPKTRGGPSSARCWPRAPTSSPIWQSNASESACTPWPIRGATKRSPSCVTTLNALEVQYPGTDLTLVYEGPGVA